MGVPAPQNDWAQDEYFKRRKISPARILVHDIQLEGWRPRTSDGAQPEPMLEINPVLSSTLDLGNRDLLAETLPIGEIASNRQEHAQLQSLVHEYGWMNCLRTRDRVQQSAGGPDDLKKCRWIHISSKFSEYLEGCFVALSGWSGRAYATLSAFRQLQQCIYQNERFSKHGQYFAPFFETLGETSSEKDNTPILISVPFLDWSVSGETPPLRFQVDPREGYQSSRASSHQIRTILQHFYRLEDTSDREHYQVFAKHQPWLTDRSLDLKVRRWYGRYPECLNVDELWILVIDARHIVTFASNQTWKSRWPPLQLASRIQEVSFRGIRNILLMAEQDYDYTSYTHVIACLSGAVGILHRSFWTDITLCITDRYAGHLSHLQYRLHRSPSTKLVMDLLQVQEELGIIIQISQQQIDLITSIQGTWNRLQEPPSKSRAQSHASAGATRHSTSHLLSHPSRATFRQFSSSELKDPMSQLLDNLKREFADLCDLRDNSNNLVNRTIQLVNIRLEDHGKAILVFTIVTIIFLPLSFVSSFFGMNTKDIRTMESKQGLFWLVSCCLTVGVVGFAVFLAFYGSAILEAFFIWKANRSRPKAPKHKNKKRLPPVKDSFRSFEVLDVTRGDTAWQADFR